MRIFPRPVFVFAASLCLLIDYSAAAGDTSAPAYELPGAYEHKLFVFPNLTDPARSGRRVPVKGYLPKGEGPFPIIIMSHGGAGTWDGHLYYAEHMVSHGYAVFCPEHIRSNKDRLLTDLWNGKGRLKARTMNALRLMTIDPEAVLERPRDISFVINQATKWNKTHAVMQGQLDLTRIAVMGHSFGAYTTLAICGATVMRDKLDPPADPPTGNAHLADPRVTIGIALSPQGLGTSRFNEESFSAIDRPLLCFSGTEDKQFRWDGKTQPAETRLTGWALIPPGPRDLLWVANADHMSFTANPREKMFRSPARPTTQKLVKAMMLVFCEMHLREDEIARAAYTKAYAATFCDETVTSISWFTRDPERTDADPLPEMLPPADAVAPER